MEKKNWIPPKVVSLDVSGTLGGDPSFPLEGMFVPVGGTTPVNVGPGS